MHMHAYDLTNSGACGGQNLTLVCFPQSTSRQFLAEPRACTSATKSLEHLFPVSCVYWCCVWGGSAMHSFFMWMLGI